MEFLHIKIDSRIDKNSLEYKSLTDENKNRSIKELTKQYIDSDPSIGGGGQQHSIELLKIVESKNTDRDYFIPIRDFEIYHIDSGYIGLCGGVFDCDGKYVFKQNKKVYEALQGMFDCHRHFSLLSIRRLTHIKGFVKKWLYILANPKDSFKTRMALNDNKPKIMWFESAYKNMYHAIFQYYPSLCMLIERMKNLGIDDYFVICPKKDSYWYGAVFEELLSLAGVDENKRIYLDNCNLGAKNIYYSSFPNEIPNIITKVIAKLQDCLNDDDNTYDFERLYISRKKSKIRFLSNEDEIRNILEKEYGFRTVYMEDYNLKEKFNIIKNAKIVLSIDGTSLVNALFSKQQCKMIGLRLHSLTEHMFIMSAMFDNISYLPIVCDISQEIFDDGYNNDCQWHSSNLHLNPSYLRERLESYGVARI